MPRSCSAIINPKILIWARTNIGYSIVDAAKKIRVKEEKLSDWENGKKYPTIKQLRKIGKVYKRPIAVFYLSKPPLDFQPLKDFRRLPGQIAGIISPKLKIEIQKAYTRREIAIELYELLEGSIPKFKINGNITDDPDELAKTIRKKLNFSIKKQIEVQNNYEALKLWRSAIENTNVLVFQTSGIDIEEMRGFSIVDKPLPVISINSKDSPFARIFSMLHEFIHIIIGHSGLCDYYEYEKQEEEKRVEIFCNRVAGSLLLPEDQLLNDSLVKSKMQASDFSLNEIYKISRVYMVSREVVLRRLLIVGKITKHIYEKRITEIEEEYLNLPKKEKESRPIPRFRITISNSGHLFIKLLLNNYYVENITSRDLSDYLNTKLKHMGKIESEVMGQSVEFGALN